MDISVIVPVFKGEKTLEMLYEGIRANLKYFGSFEVLFVYDQGPDDSWETLKILKKNYPREIRIFKLKKNYGQHNAILFGISKSEGDFIVTMDEDLQHDPNCIVRMLEKQREGNYSVVYGRFSDPKHPFFRKIASKLLRLLLKFMIPGLGYYSSFRIIKKESAHKIILLKNSYTFIDAKLLKVTSEFGFLDIEHRENTIRKSTYNFTRLSSHAVQIILAYTGIARWLLSISFMSMVFDLLSVQFRLLGTEIEIWILIIGIIMFLSGIAGEMFHRWEIKNNLLPVISIETD